MKLLITTTTVLAGVLRFAGSVVEVDRREARNVLHGPRMKAAIVADDTATHEVTRDEHVANLAKFNGRADDLADSFRATAVDTLADLPADDGDDDLDVMPARSKRSKGRAPGSPGDSD